MLRCSNNEWGTMLTGAEYKASLDDGRKTYFEGEKIDDLVGHPL